jgi:PAS domain S-box-containing protein
MASFGRSGLQMAVCIFLGCGGKCITIRTRRPYGSSVSPGHHRTTQHRIGFGEGEQAALHLDGDESGQIIGTFGLSRDITQLKKLENALSGERNLLRSVVNNIPDPIFVKDSQGRYVLDNVAHRHSVGQEHEEEIIGKTVFDFFSESSALNFSEIDETILKSGVPMINFEEEATWPDGTRRWLLTTKVPLRDEAQTVIVCIKRDITQRKLADKEVARLTQELVAKNKALQEDLEMARELQSALLPQHFPSFPHDATRQESAVRFYHFFQPWNEQ